MMASLENVPKVRSLIIEEMKYKKKLFSDNKVNFIKLYWTNCTFKNE